MTTTIIKYHHSDYSKFYAQGIGSGLFRKSLYDSYIIGADSAHPYPSSLMFEHFLEDYFWNFMAYSPCFSYWHASGIKVSTLISMLEPKLPLPSSFLIRKVSTSLCLRCGCLLSSLEISDLYLFFTICSVLVFNNFLTTCDHFFPLVLTVVSSVRSSSSVHYE